MSRSQFQFRPVFRARARRIRKLKIKAGPRILIAAGIGVAAIAIAAGVALARPDAPADAAVPNPGCGDWQRATASTEYLAPNDIYRICADRMQALIIEDAHNTLVEYPIPAN